MLAEAIGLCTTGITAVLTWFGQILNAIPFSWPLILTLIVVTIATGRLLLPLIGNFVGGYSDSALDKEAQAFEHRVATGQENVPRSSGYHPQYKRHE